MRIINTISALALITSAALLPAATEGATAGNRSTHNGASELREVPRDRDHDRQHNGDHNKKHKDHNGKHKAKGDNRCGGKKKCPIVVRIHHPSGGSGPPPIIGSGPGQSSGTGLGNIGKPAGGPNLGDPGYNRPSAGGSSGRSGAGSPRGPGRDPVENGSGTTLKLN